MDASSHPVNQIRISRGGKLGTDFIFLPCPGDSNMQIVWRTCQENLKGFKLEIDVVLEKWPWELDLYEKVGREPAGNCCSEQVRAEENPCTCVCVQSWPTLCEPTDCSPPASSSMGFSRQEPWSGLPFPPPGGLPDPRIEPKSLGSPALADGFFTTASLGNP